MKMTAEQKKKWDESQQFIKELAESALKECDTSVNCEACGECVGYASKDLYFEDFQIICVSCGEKDGK